MTSDTVTVLLAGHADPPGRAQSLVDLLGLPQPTIALDGPLGDDGLCSWFPETEPGPSITASCDHVEATLAPLVSQLRAVRLVGHSQGGAIAVLVALTSNLPIDRVATVGAFLVQSRERRLPATASTPFQALCLYGSADDMVTVDAYEQLVEALRRRQVDVTDHIYQGGHSDLGLVASTIAAFIR
jgi:predicted esterase